MLARGSDTHSTFVPAKQGMPEFGSTSKAQISKQAVLQRHLKTNFSLLDDLLPMCSLSMTSVAHFTACKNSSWVQAASAQFGSCWQAKNWPGGHLGCIIAHLLTSSWGQANGNDLCKGSVRVRCWLPSLGSSRQSRACGTKTISIRCWHPVHKAFCPVSARKQFNNL